MFVVHGLKQLLGDGCSTAALCTFVPVLVDSGRSTAACVLCISRVVLMFLLGLCIVLVVPQSSPVVPCSGQCTVLQMQCMGPWCECCMADRWGCTACHVSSTVA